GHASRCAVIAPRAVPALQARGQRNRNSARQGVGAQSTQVSAALAFVSLPALAAGVVVQPALPSPIAVANEPSANSRKQPERPRQGAPARNRSGPPDSRVPSRVGGTSSCEGVSGESQARSVHHGKCFKNR